MWGPSQYLSLSLSLSAHLSPYLPVMWDQRPGSQLGARVVQRVIVRFDDVTRRVRIGNRRAHRIHKVREIGDRVRPAVDARLLFGAGARRVEEDGWV